MDLILLEEFRTNEPVLYKKLESELSFDGKWKNIIKTLSSSRKPLLFKKDKLRRMESSQNPGDFLLNELIARQFTVSYLSEILLDSNELEALSFLKCSSDPLEITTQPGEHNSVMNLSYGEKLELICEASDIASSQYQWYHNNTPTECTKPILIIESFKPIHEGNYYCHVSCYIDDKFEYVLSSTICCKFIDVLPVFEYRNIDQKFVKQLGSNVTLSVNVISHSDCKLEWLRGNQVLKNENKENLILSNIKEEDFNEYQCVASNSAGEVFSEKFILRRMKKEKKPSTAKIALLIGNEKYENHEHLSTPCNDIILLGKKLRELGFYVLAFTNLCKSEMQSIIDQFFDMIPSEADAFFCFVGHGFQFSDNKFMMPIDCPNMSTVKMVDCICDQILVKKAKNKMLRLLVSMIDMCLKVPNSNDNPNILNEKLKQYIYEPYNACNVIRVFSTSSHQNSYEPQSKLYGIYIEHISKYLLENKSIIDIFNKAHRDFQDTEFSKFQKPYILIDGGHEMKLNSKSLDNPEIDFKLKSICLLNLPHYNLKFPKERLEVSLRVTPHRGAILNAVDLHFPLNDLCQHKVNFIPGCQMESESKVDSSPWDLTVTQFNYSGEIIFTIDNLQNIKPEHVVHMVIERKVIGENSEKVQDWCLLDLGFLFSTGQNLWYRSTEEEK